MDRLGPPPRPRSRRKRSRSRRGHIFGCLCSSLTSSLSLSLTLTDRLPPRRFWTTSHRPADPGESLLPRLPILLVGSISVLWVRRVLPRSSWEGRIRIIRIHRRAWGRRLEVVVLVVLVRIAAAGCESGSHGDRSSRDPSHSCSSIRSSSRVHPRRSRNRSRAQHRRSCGSRRSTLRSHLPLSLDGQRSLPDRSRSSPQTDPRSQA